MYAVGHKHLTEQGLCLAAVLACGKRALLSHRSAAWLWGLGPTRASPIEVSVPHRGRRRTSIRIHHAPALCDEDGALREAIPVTSVARTLLDLAGTVPAHRLERAIERAEQLSLFDLHAVDAVLARATKHAGAGRLRRGLDLYREPPFTRSQLERRFLNLVHEAGLPIPAANIFIAGYELDMYWEREKFAVELDGYEHHRTRAAFERDRAREEELSLAGIETIHLTARRLDQEPGVVMRRLAALLRKRRR